MNGMAEKWNGGWEVGMKKAVTLRNVWFCFLSSPSILFLIHFASSSPYPEPPIHFFSYLFFLLHFLLPCYPSSLSRTLRGRWRRMQRGEKAMEKEDIG